MAANETKPSRALTHRETLLVVFGVLLPVFMGSLDGTILASALPSIGREFGEVHNLPWLITAYLIANTTITTLYGKISDIHGRRTTLLIAISLYMAGSLVCALAPNMFVLILGRVLHGLGGGGLTSTGMVVLGDIAAPKDRGKYYGYFSATYTTAGACGPALGGFLAEYLHWSAIFWINIPMGILALTLALTLLKKLPRHEQPHKLDFLGAFLFMTAGVSFMLALSMGGVRYPWSSPPILTLFAFSVIVGASFVWRLLTAPEPLIPLAFFSTPATRLIIAANAFGWGSIVGLHIFLPIYLQNVVGMSPFTAGLSVIVLAIMLNVSAGVNGVLLTRLTHYKVLPIAGLLLAIGAILVLAWRAQHVSLIEFQVLLFLIGAGFGGIPPLSATILQNSVPISSFGTAVATMQFSRNLYCTMLVAAFGAIVVAGPLEGGAVTAAAAAYSAEGFGRIFYAAAASFALALVAIVMVEAKPLQTSHA
jgi:EmrB/QacA subfamily drug resistance transporter